ncbi:unnamed protein product, partial [Amoebophrya sp. A25]|eukprot:GSA25T00019536001.1
MQETTVGKVDGQDVTFQTLTDKVKALAETCKKKTADLEAVAKAASADADFFEQLVGGAPDKNNEEKMKEYTGDDSA